MNFNVKVDVDINTKKIMQQRGLGGDHRARVYLAEQIYTQSEPYTPMQTGMLVRQAVVAKDGSTLTYTAPYAHYQWYGKVMGPNYTNGDRFWSGKAPKKYTGKDLDYSGGPMRGPHWVERMLADKSKEIASSLKKYIGGLV